MADVPANLKCPTCSFVGKSPQSLKVHIGRMHGAPKAKPAKGGPGRRGKACKLCGKIVKTPAALKAHTTRMHGGPGARPTVATAPLTQLDRDLMGLSLPALANLFEATKKDLNRRLAAWTD